MKYFGTVKSFDEITGHGFIIPEIGGEALRFARGSGSWTRVYPPRPGQRLSYDVHHTNGMPNAPSRNMRREAPDFASRGSVRNKGDS